MESIWSKTCKMEKRDPLIGEIRTEVVVIGAGMAGMLTAYQLTRAGIRTVVFEAGQIGSGQTKNTTAKITSQHGIFCDAFIRKKGITTARVYVQANQKAIEEYGKIIQDDGIFCDFERTDSYVYSMDENQLKDEAEAAKKLGVCASFEKNIGVPFPHAGAVCFADQAQFHPLKFLKAISDKLEIYEGTSAKNVEGNTIRTEKGVVRAEQIIFATHYPFIDFPGFYFARMHQERSYVLALKDAGTIKGMYIGEGGETLSLRKYGPYILLGGQGHRTGENTKGGCYARLREQAGRYFPGSKVECAWSAQDCMTADQMPLIGKYAKGRPNWFVASGFQKWGMTSSMVAALILKDLICGVENPYAEVFSSRRFSTEEVPGILKDGAKAVNGLGKRFFQIPKYTEKELSPGEGGIVKTMTGKAGICKGEDGEKIGKVCTACAHLGCQVAWNPDEQTWDCPCHGSRFDHSGKVLDGPAQEGIFYE